MTRHLAEFLLADRWDSQAAVPSHHTPATTEGLC